MQQDPTLTFMCEECDITFFDVGLVICSSCTKSLCGYCARESMDIHKSFCKLDIEDCIFCITYYRTVNIEDPDPNKLTLYALKLIQEVDNHTCVTCMKSINIKG